MRKVHGSLSNCDDSDLELLRNNPEEFWSGVRKIGSEAFKNCLSLTEISLPEGITEFAYNAFSDCSSLTKISLPNSLRRIGGRSFFFCSSLTEIRIPERLTQIEASPFIGCSSLTKIEVDKNNPKYYSENNCLIDSESKTLIVGCKNSVIPENVRAIGSDAFAGCSSVTEITIPDGVTEIRDGAFFGCKGLTKIKLPESITQIKQDVFWGCESLTEITIPESVTEIKNNAFVDCSSLAEITIPEGVTKIGNGAFFNCSSLTEITIPEGVTEIGNNAFAGCSSLTKLEVDKNNPKYYSENNCLIDSESKTLMAGCKNSIIPENVRIIGNNAFSGCSSLTEITIPESVTEIGESAFENCSSLIEIRVPASVTKIGDNAFTKCSSLTKLEVDKNNPKYYSENNCLIESESKTLIAGCKNSIIPENVRIIGKNAFSDCSSLAEITIPEGVTKIGNSAFFNCSSLTEITIPEGVTDIGINAFSNCSSLTEISLPKTVTSVEKSAFEGCSLLKNVYLSNDNGVRCSFLPKQIESIDFDYIKKVVSLRRTPIQQKQFETLCNRCGVVAESSSYVEFYKLCYTLGLMEPKEETIVKNGKKVKMSDVAYTLLQGAFNSEQINVDLLHANLSSLAGEKPNKALLEFMAKSKENADEVFKHMENFTAIESWFRTREELDITNVGNDNALLPTKEENRYKVRTYTQSEDGVYREHWNAPTVELILKELSEKVYDGITRDNLHIAKALGKYPGYKEQKFFDKAVEIDKERKQLVKEGKIKNSLTEGEVKQDLEEAVKQYEEETEQLEEQIVSNLSECVSDLADVRKDIFTYEMLDKSSEEIFVMGNLTSCCARLFGAGAGAQRAMIIHPDMQPLVVRDPHGEIVAFSIVYVNREKGYAVLNDVEMNDKYDDSKDVKEIYDAWIAGVNAFVEQYNKENEIKINKVHCGISPRPFNSFNKYVRRHPEGEILEAVNFNDFAYIGSAHWAGDWFDKQFVLIDEEDSDHE